MTARLIVYFDNEGDMIRVLQLLKDSGLDKLAFYTQTTEKLLVEPEKRDWSLAGSVDLGDKLASISNLRDFAYND
ncbi:MAG: hypothetical protein H6560_10765 [Lewinellaceae bacterium]|nr:hypothetical protein [Lewinellaceae bacterium]